MGKKGKRYTQQEKTDLLTKYNQLRELGTNAYDAAKKVGISYITIRSWEKKGGVGRRTRGAAADPSGAASRNQTQALPATSPSSGIVLTCPNGCRLEGLTAEEALKILRSY